MPGTKMKNLPGVYKNQSDKFPMTARKETRQFDSKGNVITPRLLANIPRNTIRVLKFLFQKEIGLDIFLNKARITITKSPPYEIGRWFYKQVLKYEENN